MIPLDCGHCNKSRESENTRDKFPIKYEVLYFYNMFFQADLYILQTMCVI